MQWSPGTQVCVIRLQWAMQIRLLTNINFKIELEQLQGLCSEDITRGLMITHSIESYWIPRQKKTKSKLQI